MTKIEGILLALALLLGIAGTALIVLDKDEVPASDPVVQQRQRELASEVPKAQKTAKPAATGKGLATMRIPRFGKTWKWVAVEGTSPKVIAKGPGHYSWTPLPGEYGNVGFAAHRAGYGDPFIDFDLLVPGDKVYLSQGRTTWVYEITMKPKIIKTSERWVLDPLEGYWLTLTTCWPKYGDAKRMYVRAELKRTEQ